MIKKTIVSGLFSLLLILILSGCGNSKYRGTPTGIQVVPQENAYINYGHTFKLRTYLIYSSGDRKDITGKMGLEINVKDTENRNERVSINAYPLSFLPDSLEVSAVYTKRKYTFSTQAKIPFNYNGDLKLTFNGASGEPGNSGSDGSTALLFRYGKNGEAGGTGGIGNNGHDLSVHVYKDELSQLYYLRVMDITTSALYYYKTKDTGYALKFESIGGTGGRGGTGGTGGDGKDGKKTEKKTKRPGYGGDGGIGGNGGNGGTGGTVYLFVHPSAEAILRRVSLVNIGGVPGDGGSGGKGGKAGTPLEGQESKADGNTGASGNPGYIGQVGPPLQISVEDFDIDY